MKKLLKIRRYGYGFLLSVLLMLVLSLVVKADDGEDNYQVSNQSVLLNKIAQASTTTSTKVITLTDSDGDGLLDENDPHPNIAEIYIVEDKDKNGIVDGFEK